MPKDKFRVLLVSVGIFGQRYLTELTSGSYDATLVGIVDVVPHLEEKYPVISQLSIPVFPTMEAFYARNAADLVIICSPIHLHTEMILCALDHGSNVLCEKPLCADPAETRQLEQAAAQKNLILSVGWQLNYDRTVQKIKQLILSGAFGPVRGGKCLHGMRRGRNYYSRNNWSGHLFVHGKPVMDSPFMNGCAHTFQMMTYLLGNTMTEAEDIVRVEGELYRANPTLENYDIAALRCFTRENVPLLYLTCHAMREENLGRFAEMEFEAGTLIWEEGLSYRFVYRDGREPLDFGPDSSPRFQKLHDMLACMRGQRDLPLSLPHTGLPHLHAVLLAQNLPVQDIPADRIDILEEKGDRFCCPKNLESVLREAYAKNALPMEIGLSLVR